MSSLPAEDVLGVFEKQPVPGGGARHRRMDPPWQNEGEEDRVQGSGHAGP